MTVREPGPTDKVEDLYKPRHRTTIKANEKMKYKVLTSIKYIGSIQLYISSFFVEVDTYFQRYDTFIIINVCNINIYLVLLLLNIIFSL